MEHRIRFISDLGLTERQISDREDSVRWGRYAEEWRYRLSVDGAHGNERELVLACEAISRWYAAGRVGSMPLYPTYQRKAYVPRGW